MRVIWITLFVICLFGFFLPSLAAENISITFDPIGDHSISERYINISGSTNHPVVPRDGLFVGIYEYPPSPGDCVLPECYRIFGMIPVYSGNGSLNQWSVFYDMEKTGTFMIDIEDPETGFSVSKIFNITAKLQTTTVTRPFIAIDPIANQTPGTIFYINGTTDSDPNKTVMLSISCFDLSGGPVSVFQSPVLFKTGNSGMSYWSYNASATPDFWQHTPHQKEYSYSKECSVFAWINESPNVNDRQKFDIFPAETQTPSTLDMHPATTKRSSIPMVLPIVVIAIACIIKFKKTEKS